MVQPMLSRQVRALEEELGVQLVHRNGRGIVLTEAGSLLNEYAKGILATLARAESRGRRAALQPARQRRDRHAAVDGLRC